MQSYWRPLRRILTTGRIGNIVRFGYHQHQSLLRAVGYSVRMLRQGLGAKLSDDLGSGATSQSLWNAALKQTFGVIPNGRVVLPVHACPLVSIIIPVHNQWQYTLWCLRSIVANSGNICYEVLVADDASTDATREIADCVENVRVIRNDVETGGPLGFLRNCNGAARHARGKYVLFLNNDTLVQKGWLESLVEVAEQDASVGLVGAKLVYPNRRLQEAGGIIWQDGSGNNYGRGGLVDAPECNYLRETDYVSGAAILVRHSLWKEIGGFDERFAPAYYEDADLAFEIRRRGCRVVYQPAAEVIHFEGVSHGTNLRQGVKRHQTVNRTRFVEKWRDVLAREHFLPHEDVFLARGHSCGRPCVLVIDWNLPTPDRDSGSLRMANLLRILVSLGCQATFFPIKDESTQPYLRQLQQQGVFVAAGPGSMPLDAFLKKHGRYFDTVIVSRVSAGAVCMRTVKRRCSKARVVFDTVDLCFLREQRRAELENSDAARRAAAVAKETELGLMRQADATLVVSPVEKELLGRMAPDVDVRILSNIHALHDRGDSFDQRNGLVFIGGFRHSPNVDAVRWFVEEVFPKVRQRLPGVVLHVIGSHPPADLRNWAETVEGVRFHGFVENVEPYLRSCRLSVVPLRYGAGVKGKINLSMSYGLPVVSTSIGCEGMFLNDGLDVLMADGADAMAAAVCRLHEDQALWERISEAGFENVREHFSFEAATETVRGMIGGQGWKGGNGGSPHWTRRRADSTVGKRSDRVA
jgi:GT2 family glycosyltransferase